MYKILGSREYATSFRSIDKVYEDYKTERAKRKPLTSTQRYLDEKRRKIAKMLKEDK